VQSAGGFGNHPVGRSQSNRRTGPPAATCLEQQERPPRAAVAARDLEREIAHLGVRAFAFAAVDHAGWISLPALDIDVASLILAMTKTAHAQTSMGQRSALAPLDINLRPAEGISAGTWKRGPQMSIAAPPAAEFDRETAPAWEGGERLRDA